MPCTSSILQEKQRELNLAPRSLSFTLDGSKLLGPGDPSSTQVVGSSLLCGIGGPGPLSAPGAELHGFPTSYTLGSSGVRARERGLRLMGQEAELSRAGGTTDSLVRGLPVGRGGHRQGEQALLGR